MRRYWLALPLVGALGLGAVLDGQRGGRPGRRRRRQGQTERGRPEAGGHAADLAGGPVQLGGRALHPGGEVEGDARVDLTFPEQDINDLIKSMTLRDLSPTGRVAAVTYDSHDPIDRTLASFAINLNNSPSLAQILTQARGEQVEVALVNTANQPGSLTGKIIGVEQQAVPSKEGTVPVAVLNLWCAEGVRAVKLTEVQRLRFANPVLENEVRRALETLALSHDSQKKAVSLHFAGEGKRKVEVGYVVENPIWKTSYRLVLGKDEGKKPYLQGWAVVENPTDEDWHEVTMALVSGRPISFKMDLYNPLYVARPTVEPELFASLRPPTYSGKMRGFDDNFAKEAEQADKPTDAKKADPRTGAVLGGLAIRTEPGTPNKARRHERERHADEPSARPLRTSVGRRWRIAGHQVGDAGASQYSERRVHLGARMHGHRPTGGDECDPDQRPDCQGAASGLRSCSSARHPRARAPRSQRRSPTSRPVAADSRQACGRSTAVRGGKNTSPLDMRATSSRSSVQAEFNPNPLKAYGFATRNTRNESPPAAASMPTIHRQPRRAPARGRRPASHQPTIVRPQPPPFVQTSGDDRDHHRTLHATRHCATDGQPGPQIERARPVRT